MPLAAQQGIELAQLAAFAFMPHPASFGRVPASGPVQQVEPAAGHGRVLVIQRFDCLAGSLQQRRILIQRLLLRVEEVGEQGKMQIAVAVGQVAHLHAFHQFIDILRAANEGRHDHQGAGICGNALAVIEARQHVRRHRQGHQPVHQADGQATGHQQNRYAEHGQVQQRPMIGMRQGQQGPGQYGAEQQRRGQEEIQRRTPEQALPPLDERQPHAELSLQRRYALIDQVKTDMGRAWCIGRRAGGQCERRVRDCCLVVLARSGQALHRMPIVIAGGEVHARVDAGRVLAQHLFHATHVLDELAPIGGREHAQAVDAVADGNLLGRL